jgi:hypothetical protein
VATPRESVIELNRNIVPYHLQTPSYPRFASHSCPLLVSAHLSALKERSGSTVASTHHFTYLKREKIKDRKQMAATLSRHLKTALLYLRNESLQPLREQTCVEMIDLFSCYTVPSS